MGLITELRNYNKKPIGRLAEGGVLRVFVSIQRMEL